MGVSIFCPYCHQATAVSAAPLRLTNATPFGGDRGAMDMILMGGFAAYRGPERSLWWIGKCNACHHPMLVDWDGSDTIYPAPLPRPVSEKIPQPMRDNLTQALRALSANAPDAAAAMARRCVQGACRQHGAKVSTLEKEIDDLAAKGVIIKALAEMAHEVRWVGNDGAHPSKEEVDGTEPPLTKEEAAEAVSFAEAFLDALYVQTALVKEAKDRREAAKKKVKA